ncbi:alpha and gamma adaptin binding protein p34-domain-containing protein [Colletotrichum navitas]|uniref:Alpha and gamma adaptin binding protein p34-domain-containing protein n=1 Tax=Colletotrichum navitas TaxID=681940 RepID=A0AAD8VCC7_9PEZI|nr:alpha and gamma adaptin binding protein p34-domain-containing protein [Colletotrichum navitas]KAK1599405.1 alpha and gamma adaptin binding protein p34-domain-containing protein [Colletotrichum navitas]
MDIKNPRRVLAVSLADSKQHLSRVIKDLTGNHPEPASTTLAGTTHVLSLKTSYYSADVPIWLDLISSPAEWSESFLSPEAKEVLSVLGGMAVVFALPSTSSSSTAAPVADKSPVTATAPAAPPAPPSADETRALITEVGRVVREGLGGWGWDGVSLGIGVGDGDADEWEELCAEWGLEFVQVRGGKKDEGKNEFGEKMGIPRVLEALESNDWDAADDLDGGLSDLDSDEEPPSGLPRSRRPLAEADGDGDEDENDLDPESLDFGFDKSDFEGLKKAIWNLDQEQQPETDEADDDDYNEKKCATREALAKNNTEEGAGKSRDGDDEDEELDGDEVEKIERMMRKLQAVRDMSAGLPEEQRRKMAKKAVGEVMKEL